jgi:ketosteroid isomerase-like protein
MTTEQDPVAVVRAFDAAWNAHDLEAVMACFAADAVVTQLPPPPDGGVHRGTEQIRRWVAAVLPGFHVDSRGHRARGDTVPWTASVRGDLFRELGFPQPFEAAAEAVVRAGKIASFTGRNPPPPQGGGQG